MRITRLALATTAIFISASALANAACENDAKTRDDFLACSKRDTDKILSDSEKLYRSIRALASDGGRAELDKNYKIWNNKLKSDCSVIAYSFNEWRNDYTPDTDFQVSSCRAKIATQELEFYKWLACPDDMERSKVPDCAAVRKVLSDRQ